MVPDDSNRRVWPDATRPSGPSKNPS